MKAFNLFTSLWYNTYGEAPFTSKTLQSAAETSSMLASALRTLAPNDSDPSGISINRLTRLLQTESTQCNQDNEYALVSLRPGIWKLIRREKLISRAV